jgi:hypothetical protein
VPDDWQDAPTPEPQFAAGDAQRGWGQGSSHASSLAKWQASVPGPELISWPGWADAININATRGNIRGNECGDDLPLKINGSAKYSCRAWCAPRSSNARYSAAR